MAAGIVPIAHASDGGGSIRIPASCCGLVGMKPTRARTPAGPDAGEGWSGMGAVHAVSRSVRDNAALLDATAGPDLGAPYWAPPPERPYLEEVGRPAGRLRIAFQSRSFNGVETHPECTAAVEEASRLCAELGHEVEPADGVGLLRLLQTLGARRLPEDGSDPQEQQRNCPLQLSKGDRLSGHLNIHQLQCQM